jgi:hypothetical protein
VPPFGVLILVAALLGVSLFFQLSRNAVLKRRWWRPWLIVVGAALTAYGWVIGGLPMAAALLLGSLVFGRINARRIQFCESCGRTVNSVDFLNPPATFCPSCGASLENSTVRAA